MGLSNGIIDRDLIIDKGVGHIHQVKSLIIGVSNPKCS